MPLDKYTWEWLQKLYPGETHQTPREGTLKRQDDQMKRWLSKHKHDIDRLINARTCTLWPDCSCYHTLTHWERQLANDELSWTVPELAWAETAIYFSLSCAAAHCPDQAVKAYCQDQLANSWFDRQRNGQELTEEIAERLRAEQ
jgi:hypothetical protein